MNRSKSSKAWLKRQHEDYHTKAAKLSGYRSRAAYKLLEIQEKQRFLKPGMRVVDLGSAPGGWAQVARQTLGKVGHVFALDILPMESIEGVDSIQGDCRDEAVLAVLQEKVGRSLVDVVLSDMAPNFSGVAAVDQARAVYLGELALDFATQVLKPGGTFLVKLFQGTGFDDYLRQVKLAFSSVSILKPKASRPESREVYILARRYGNSPPVRA